MILFSFPLFVLPTFVLLHEQVKVATCRKEVAGEKETARTAATTVEMVVAEEIVTVAAEAVTMVTVMRDI